MADLLKIGTSGVLTQQTLLQTTSNNISNVNTVGYSRQDNIVHTNIINQGCGYIETRRVIDNYAEREVLRDNASVGYYEALSEGMKNVDSLLSDSSTGLSPIVTELFSNIQAANTNPTSVANRNELLSSVQTTKDRISTISSNIQNEYRTANEKIVESVNAVNQLLDGIYKMNQNLISTSAKGADSSARLQMLDERDQMITELSQYLDVKTVEQPNGSVYVNMASGQTLVLGDGCATLFAEPSTLDNAEYSLKFTYGNSKTSLSKDVGGKIAGYFDACDNLKNAQRQIGQMTVALADALNCQNNSGLTLTNEVGSDIFKLKDITVQSDSKTSTMTMSFAKGQGSKVTGNDYLVVAKDNTGNNFEIFEADGDSYVSRGTFAAVDGKLSLGEEFGFDLQLNSTASQGDKFLVQPTINAGFNLEVAITRPEDFGFASVVRVNQNANNLGNASVSLSGVTNTLDTSAFEINGQNVSLKAGAPIFVTINEDGNYVVCSDKNGQNVIGTVDASTKGQNLLSNVKDATGALVYTDVNTYPGYDFNINGTVKTGDKFSVELNLNGFADNSNGILMQDIEQAKIVYGTVSKSFTEAYSSTVSSVGTQIKVSDINLSAATSKLEQSKALSEGSKGVELNEEAANLVRFQQSYAASAKIISAAQTVFDSLLSAVR